MDDGPTSSYVGTSRRKVIQALGASAAVPALAGCGGLLGGGDTEDEDFGDTLRIGALGPPPESEPTGASIMIGAEIAAAELNEDGGVLGADVEIVRGNTEGTAEGARDVYSELVLDEDVDLTIGNFISEALLAIVDDIADEQLLHLVTGSGTPQVTQNVADDYDRYKYLFRIGPFNSYFLGKSLVDFAAEFYEDELGWQRTAILVENAAWTTEVVEVLNNQLDDHGFDVVDTKSYAIETESFAPIFDDIQGQDIDGATTVMAHTGGLAASQWASQQRPFGFGGIHVPAQFPFMDALMGSAINNVWTQTTATAGVSITEKTAPFTQSFMEAHPEGQPPVYTGYIAYDAVHLLADYAEHVGSANTDDLIAAMESNELSLTTTTTNEFEFYGPDDETEFGQFPHDIVYSKEDWLSGDSAPVWLQWQDGEQKIIEPDAHSNADYQSPAWM